MEMFRGFVGWEVTRTGIDYQKGSHQFLNWWQQYATGILHLDRFESLSKANKKHHPNGWRFLLAEDEGFDYQKGSHQFLNWWQRYATGISHLNGFESLSQQ